MDWCVLRLESDVCAEERSAWVRRVWCCGDVRAVVLKNEDGVVWGRIVRCGAAVAALEDLTGDVTTMRALRENILRCERAWELLLRRAAARGAELGDVERCVSVDWPRYGPSCCV